MIARKDRVRIRELAAWGFDTDQFRPAALESVLAFKADRIAQRTLFAQSHVLLEPQTEKLRNLFDSYTGRPDLVSEMAGLSWSLGVVDIRPLLAFQRRLAFSPSHEKPSLPQAGDWPSLFACSFGPPKPIRYEMTCIRETGNSTQTFILQSANPDLHVRTTSETAFPFSVHAGGPFFEVACFRGRWFLRDGYHRAYALLEAGVFEVPAVIVQAATLEELGADAPCFFPEEVLLSQAPPRVINFLDPELVLEYERAPFLKTIHIQIQETLESTTHQGENS